MNFRGPEGIDIVYNVNRQILMGREGMKDIFVTKKGLVGWNEKLVN